MPPKFLRVLYTNRSIRFRCSSLPETVGNVHTRAGFGLVAAYGFPLHQEHDERAAVPESLLGIVLNN